MSRYQGVVPLEGQGLEAAADQYFRQSEQIPTLVRLAVAQNVTGEGSRLARRRPAGAVPARSPRTAGARPTSHPGDAPAGVEPRHDAEDDAWTEAKALAGTVEDHELVDPTLSSERLLYRLFHERGVTVFEPQDAARRLPLLARADRGHAAQLLARRSAHDMIGPDGKIGVTCEFCGAHRDFDPADFDPPRRRDA